MSVADRSDAALLAAATHDPGAFRELYDRHTGAINAFALRRVGDRDAALEITAETFARAWYRRRAFRDERGGSALPWLYGIAANVLRESARRHRLASEAVDRLGIVLAVDRDQIAPDESWVDGLEEDLVAALASLTDDQRAAVLGRVVGDAPYDELAATLGCNPATARARVSRGLSQLRRFLQEVPDDER